MTTGVYYLDNNLYLYASRADLVRQQPAVCAFNTTEVWRRNGIFNTVLGKDCTPGPLTLSEGGMIHSLTESQVTLAAMGDSTFWALSS